MQSGAEEEWDDEDWDDMDDSESSLSFISDMSLFTNMRIAIGVSLVILLLLCSMVFTNFGLYYGAGGLSVLIDVNEGKDTSDRTFNFNILATSPTLGMLAKEGSYKIVVSPISYSHTDGSVAVASGSFTLNDEGRVSVSIPYSDLFAMNGDYTVQVELGSKKATDSVTINKFAETAIADLALFDGSQPLDKNEGVIINLQFLSENVTQAGEPVTVIPWATGKITLYHSEEVFESGNGEDYWNTDGSRDLVSVEIIDFVHSGDKMTFTYDSGAVDNTLPFILDTSEFYGVEGSGDYAMIIEFSNDLGSDTSSKSGQSFWKWFHICEVKNSECDGNK